MIRFVVALFVALIVSPAAAQQQPDQPVILQLQRTIAVLEQQRNNAMNAAVNMEIRLTDELVRAQARIKELEPKVADAPPAAK